MRARNFTVVETNGTLALRHEPNAAYLDFEQASFTLNHYAAISVGSRRFGNIYA